MQLFFIITQLIRASSENSQQLIFGIPMPAFVDAYKDLKDNTQLSIAYDVLLSNKSIQKLYAKNVTNPEIPHQLLRQALLYFPSSEFATAILSHVENNRTVAVLENEFLAIQKIIFDEENSIPTCLVNALINEDRLLKDLGNPSEAGAFYAGILQVESLKFEFYNKLNLILQNGSADTNQITALKIEICNNITLDTSIASKVIYHGSDFELSEIFLQDSNENKKKLFKEYFNQCKAYGHPIAPPVKFEYLLNILKLANAEEKKLLCSAMYNFVYFYYVNFTNKCEAFIDFVAYAQKESIFSHRFAELDNLVNYFELRRFKTLMYAIKYTVITNKSSGFLSRFTRRKSNANSLYDIEYLKNSYKILSEIFPEIDLEISNKLENLKAFKEFVIAEEMLEILNVGVDEVDLN